MGRFADGRLTDIKLYSPDEQDRMGAELVEVAEHPAFEEPRPFYGYDASRKRAVIHTQEQVKRTRQQLIDLEQRRAAAERLGLTTERDELAARIAELRA